MVLFLSTHAFLLGNGQTYPTLGVPYYRVSRIFMSRIFDSCNTVPHFHVPQVNVSHFQRPRVEVVTLLRFVVITLLLLLLLLPTTTITLLRHGDAENARH